MSILAVVLMLAAVCAMLAILGWLLALLVFGDVDPDEWKEWP